jgi:hypothetical protein
MDFGDLLFPKQSSTGICLPRSFGSSKSPSLVWNVCRGPWFFQDPALAMDVWREPCFSESFAPLFECLARNLSSSKKPLSCRMCGTLLRCSTTKKWHSTPCFRELLPSFQIALCNKSCLSRSLLLSKIQAIHEHVCRGPLLLPNPQVQPPMCGTLLLCPMKKLAEPNLCSRRLLSFKDNLGLRISRENCLFPNSA